MWYVLIQLFVTVLIIDWWRVESNRRTIRLPSAVWESNRRLLTHQYPKLCNYKFATLHAWNTSSMTDSPLGTPEIHADICSKNRHALHMCEKIFFFILVYFWTLFKVANDLQYTLATLSHVNNIYSLAYTEKVRDNAIGNLIFIN